MEKYSYIKICNKANFLLNEFTLKFTVQTTWFSYNFSSTVMDMKNGTPFKNQSKSDNLFFKLIEISVLANFMVPNY